jgi:hypothetical protein
VSTGKEREGIVLTMNSERPSASDRIVGTLLNTGNGVSTGPRSAPLGRSSERSAVIGPLLIHGLIGLLSSVDLALGLISTILCLSVALGFGPTCLLSVAKLKNFLLVVKRDVSANRGRISRRMIGETIRHGTKTVSQWRTEAKLSEGTGQ